MVAVAIGFVWEMAQAPLFAPMGGWVIWIVEGKGAKAKSVLDSGVRSRVDTLIL